MAERGRPKRVLIVGSGIAGPVLALFLQRVGHDPVVFEGRPTDRGDEGSFLGIAPNGRDVLATLGLREQIEALGVATPRIAFHNHKGRELAENPQPIVTIRRGALSQAIATAAAAAGIDVRHGERVERVEQRGDRVLAHFADDDDPAEGDLLVGCDGIHSAVRRSIMPDAPGPKYTGLITSGAFTRVDGLGSTDGAMHMTFCQRGFFGYQVDDDGVAWWFENLYDPTEPSPSDLGAITDDDWKRRLIEVHRSDHEPIGAILEATDGPIARYPIHEMPILPRWHVGRVCLAGDAAHAVGPHSGQGGSLAMEDAIVLARCLRDADIEEALETYQSIRKPRAEYVAHETRQIGNRKAPPGAIGRTFRDLLLPIFLRRGVKVFEPIYAHHIEW